MNPTLSDRAQLGTASVPAGISASGAPQTVAIVGGGFSGTMIARSLLTLARHRALHVVLIDRAQISGGVAYAARAYPYPLNVPAGRMWATSTDPSEFVRFARRQIPTAAATDFLPRELYGQYLKFSLASAERHTANVRLERVHGSAVGITLRHEVHRSEVRLSDGRKIRADAIVLAVGNPPPAPLPGAQECDPSQYVADPWKTPPEFHAGETVLIVGTGLTMVDIVLAGTETTRGRVIVHAISRHGLIPLPQAPPRRGYEQHHGILLSQLNAQSIRNMLRAARALAGSSRLHGRDWREVIAGARAHASGLWHQLPEGERRRFLRHVRPYWDIHRHRVPEKVSSAINELRTAGILRVNAGRLVTLKRQAGRICAQWRPRGTSFQAALLVDRVINCTGPDYHLARTEDPLLQTLLWQGTIVPDRLGLGLITRKAGRIVDASGHVARNLYYIGPMLRAEHWEATATQELGKCAEEIAWDLLRSLDAMKCSHVPDVALDSPSDTAARTARRRLTAATGDEKERASLGHHGIGAIEKPWRERWPGKLSSPR